MAVTKKLLGAAGAVALSLGALAPAAQAEDKIGYSITLTGISDYLFRGISYTDEAPAFQPYIEFTYNIFYFALWGSNIDAFNTYGPWEVDFYAGMRPTTGPITWDIAALYYTYGARSGSGVSEGDIDYVEFKVSASMTPVQNLTLTATGYYTPDQDLATPETETIEGTIAYALPQMGIFAPTISGQYGYTNSELDGWFVGETDYTYWNVGLKLAVEKYFMDFRYWDTSIDAGVNDGLADERFLFSAGVTLP